MNVKTCSDKMDLIVDSPNIENDNKNDEWIIDMNESNNDLIIPISNDGSFEHFKVKPQEDEICVQNPNFEMSVNYYDMDIQFSNGVVKIVSNSPYLIFKKKSIENIHKNRILLFLNKSVSAFEWNGVDITSWVKNLYF